MKDNFFQAMLADLKSIKNNLSIWFMLNGEDVFSCLKVEYQYVELSDTLQWWLQETRRVSEYLSVARQLQSYCYTHRTENIISDSVYFGIVRLTYGYSLFTKAEDYIITANVLSGREFDKSKSLYSWVFDRDFELTRYKYLVNLLSFYTTYTNIITTQAYASLIQTYNKEFLT